MYLDTKNTVRLSELIHWVKRELFSDEAFQDDSVPLFVIDEVTVEVNFVLSGEGEGGVDLQVLRAGAKVGEERVQKAIVRMKPIVPYDKARETLGETQLRQLEDEVARVLLKGRAVTRQDIPTRR